MSPFERPDQPKHEKETGREDAVSIADRALEGTAQTTGARLKARLEAFAETTFPLEAIRTLTEAAKMIAGIRVPRNAALLVLAAELAAINHAHPEIADTAHEVAQESGDGIVGFSLDALVFQVDSANALIDYIQSGGDDKSEDLAFGEQRPAQY